MNPSSDILLPQALLHSPCPTEDLDAHPSAAGTMTTVTVNEKEIDDSITSNKCKIRDILNNVYSNDGSLLIGTLTFAQSKFTSYVLKTFESQYQSDSISHLPNNQENIPATSAGHIVDRVWIEIHHPAIKYFQSKFYSLNKDSKRKLSNNKSSGLNKNPIVTVEIKKLFDRFVKFISKSFEFYFFLLKTILNTYDLSVYIPVKKLCSTLKINLDSVAATTDSTLPVNSNSLISSIVYVIHKCVLYIGDLSRYRTLIAKTYLPSTSISKEDNNNYSKSIELYKLSLLILPSLGDPYNHIAIIDNFKDDKFNVVYNFIRSSLTSNPLPIGFTNFLNLLIKQPKHNSILKKFEAQNSLERSTITKNDRLELLKSQFLVLFNYFLLPSKWKLKDGYLVKGYNISEIENDFYKLLGQLDFHKQIFNDFYFKQLVILTGGFEILIDKSMRHPDLDQSATVIGDYLNFIFRYLNTFMKVVLLNWGQDTSNPNVSTSLLPVMRLMLCWLKERELARAYLIQTPNCTMALAEIINCIHRYFKSNPDLIVEINSKELTEENLFNSKPTRKRLFKEDVTLKEFKPINYFLNDFNDDDLYKKDESAILALIGELPNDSHKNMKLNDNLLRLISIGYLGRSLIKDNSVDVKYDETTKLFNLSSKISLDLSIAVDKPSKLSPFSSPSKLRTQAVNRKKKVFTKKSSPLGLKEDDRRYTFENLERKNYDGSHEQTFRNNHEISETDADVNNTRFVDMVASIVNEENSSSSNSKNFSPPIDLSSTSNQPMNILSNNIWSSSSNNNVSSNGDLLFQQDLYNQLLNPNSMLTPPANSNSSSSPNPHLNLNPNAKQETNYFYTPSQSQSQLASSGSTQDQYLNYVSQVNALNSYNLHQLNMNNMNVGNIGSVGNTNSASNANDPSINVNMNMNMNMAMNAMMMNMIRSQDASRSSQSSNSAHNHHQQQHSQSQSQSQNQNQPQAQQPANGFDKLNDFINGNSNNQGHNSGYSGYGTF